MRLWITTAVAVALTAAFGAFAEEEAEETTLAGEPVDVTCYMADRTGPGHATCAKSCAEKGNPIGFLTVDDEGQEKLYLVLGAEGKPAKDLMAEHMGSEVEVTGKVQEKGGMSVITVSSVSTFDDLDWLPSPAAGSGSIQNE